MSELMAQFEQIAMLEKLADVQTELTEALFDRVAFLEESVLQLEQVRATGRSKNKKGRGSQPLSTPCEPGVHGEG